MKTSLERKHSALISCSVSCTNFEGLVCRTSKSCPKMWSTSRASIERHGAAPASAALGRHQG